MQATQARFTLQPGLAKCRQQLQLPKWQRFVTLPARPKLAAAFKKRSCVRAAQTNQNNEIVRHPAQKPDRGGSVAKNAEPRGTPAAPAKGPFTTITRMGAKMASNAKVLVRGAVAAAAAAAGLKIGSSVINAVEAAPLLADLELLIGAAVSTNFIVSYFGDEKARHNVDSTVAATMRTLSDALGLVNSSPAGSLGDSPSMLEVQLRSILDDSVSQSSPKNGDGPSAASVVVDRQMLIQSLAAFIQSRETKSRDLVKNLQTELQTSEEVRASLAELYKSQEARKSRKQAAANAAAQLERALASTTAPLEKERTKSKAEVSGLQQEVLNLQQSVKMLEVEKKQLAASQNQVESQLQALQQQEQQAADAKLQKQAAEFAAKLRGVEEELASLRAKEGSLQTTSAQRVAAMKAERDEAVAQVQGLQVRLGEVEGQLKEVRESRDRLLGLNSELQGRVNATMAENKALSAKVAELERTAKPAAATQVKTQGGQQTAEAVKRQVWTVQSKLEADLRKAEEEKGKYVGAVKWLEAQLEALREDKDESETRLKSSLEFAEMRAAEESKRVEELRAKIHTIEEEAVQQQNMLRQKVAALEARLGAAAAAASPAATAATSLTSVTSMPVSRTSSQLQQQQQQQEMRRTVSSGSSKSTREVLDSTRAWLAAFSDKTGSKQKKVLQQHQQQQQQKGALVNTMSDEQLKTYARAIFPAYVPANASAAEQRKGVETLVEDLIQKGAKEHWARYFVQDALFFPMLDAKGLSVPSRSSPSLMSMPAMSAPKKASPVAGQAASACTLEELKVYAKAIRSAYIDEGMPKQEQQAGMELLVEELVAMGGEEDWARSYVTESLLSAGKGKTKASRA